MRTERTGRRWLALATVVLGLLVVQVAGLAHVPIFGVRPELLLVFVLGVALQWGAGPGLALGLVTGFLADLIGGYLVGLSAVSYAAAGCAAGFIGERLYPDRGLVVLAIVAGGTVVSQVVYVAGASAFGLPWPPMDGLVKVTLTLAAYHLLLVPVVYPICRWAGGVFVARSGDAGLEA
ncbi:MAG: rod shape-determining protein MreD [Firmicutes bacterium ZCTH02-B6]|nr:MAG: rod shape-determining protein MreD [Firmicutes bacterium ZCTH02-B6]